jgi:tRNA (mo5U34)-methyltransferase
VSQPSQAQEAIGPEGTTGWYHTITLPDGSVTPGFFDHRPVLDRYELPDRLDGLRVLDVGTFDGFWAFEFERRGASEVVAVDAPDKFHLDWPGWLRPRADEDPGPNFANFEVAHRLLGSSVRRERMPVYDISPERLGEFDMVFIGSLLAHLRDPVAALEAVRTVCRGSLRVVDVVDPVLDRLNWLGSIARLRSRSGRVEWWTPNRTCLREWVESAGFVDVTVGPRFVIPYAFGRRGGIAHALVTARPPGA